MQMKIIAILFVFFTISACSGVRISDGRTIVTADKEKPFCETNKVDPNCKIESKNQ